MFNVRFGVVTLHKESVTTPNLTLNIKTALNGTDGSQTAHDEQRQLDLEVSEL